MVVSLSVSILAIPCNRRNSAAWASPNHPDGGVGGSVGHEEMYRYHDVVTGKMNVLMGKMRMTYSVS